MSLFKRQSSDASQSRRFPAGEESSVARKQINPFDPPLDAPHIANDDAPGVSVMLERAGITGRQISKLTSVISVLGGVLIGGLLVTLLNWGTGVMSVGNWVLVAAVAAPLATLALLFLITNQFFELASSLKRAQELERRLDRAGQISALSRELEHEAALIETRIEHFLSVGVGLRQELKRDHEYVEQAYKERIAQTRQAIHDLESARQVFLEDVDNVNKALQIAREFISAKIASLTSDFEDAALSAARVLDGNMTQIAQKFKGIIVKDAVRQDSVDRLIATNEKTIELIAQMPDTLNGHVQDAIVKVHGDLEKNADRLTAQIESLSDNISRSNVDLVKNLSDTPAQIDAYVANLHRGINSAFEENSRRYASELETVVTQTSGLVDQLQNFISELPRKMETGLVAIEPEMARVFNAKIQDANSEISRVIQPLLESSAVLDTTLHEVPAKLQHHVGQLGSVIDTRFAENAREFEMRLSEAYARQVEIGQSFATTLKAQFDQVVARIEHIDPEIRTSLDNVIHTLDEHVKGVTRSMTALLDDYKGKIDSANQTVIDTTEQSILGQTEKTKVLIETASQQLLDTMTQTFSQQELRSKEFELQLVALIDEFKKAKNDIQNLPNELSGSIQNQVKSLDNAIDIVLSRFNSALLANQDLASKTMAGHLNTTQQNLSHEYSLIEGRLFRSLSNFNEVVKNCITALEEASSWRLDAFDGQIKAVSEENLEQVRKEFESLAERMKLKVGELKIESSIIDSRQASDPLSQKHLAEHGDLEPMPQRLDPENPIEKLSERLANIDAILHELRQGSR